MRNVLHHLTGKNLKETVENQRRALVELKRLVRPGGAIFIEELTNPSAAACALIYFLTKLNSKIRLRFLSFYVNPNAIIYFFTPGKLSKLSSEVFGEKNILIRKIDRVKGNLIRKILHLGNETDMATFVFKK